MRGFKDYLQETILMEANVANIDAIDAYVASWMKKTQLPAGKAWFKKKLRTFLINSPDYLYKIEPNALPAGLPDYAQAAMERGEDVFMFDATRTAGNFQQFMAHLADWFEAMHRVIEAGPDAMSDTSMEDFRITEKEVQKLQKIPFEQAKAAADAWFNHMGTRLRGQKKEIEGVEVIHTWPDGFYAVRYTDPNVMKLDGRDLQNCLQHGNYWSNVRDGTNQVFGIRKPNDEAVVGIRTSQIGRRGARAAFTDPSAPKPRFEWELEECKGKANKPPIHTYIPYVIDFLKLMKNIDIGDSSDLKNAGIFFRNGEFGSFADISELVYQDRTMVIRRTDDEFQAQVGNALVKGTIAEDKVMVVQVEADDYSTLATKVLNRLGLEPTPALVRNLSQRNVFFKNGRFGTPRTVGEHLGDVDTMSVFEVATGIFAYAADAPEAPYSAHFHLSQDSRKIADFNLRSNHEFEIDVNTVEEVLNFLKIAPTLNCEVGPLKAADIYYNGEQFGNYDQVGSGEAEVGELTIYRLGNRRAWIVADADGSTAFVGILQGLSLQVLKNDLDGATDQIAPAMRWIASHHQPKSVVDANQFGIINLARQGGVVADKASLFSHLPALSSEMRAHKEGTLQYQPDSTPARIMLRCLSGAINDADARLTPAEITALTDAFSANDESPLWIERVASHKLYDIEVRGLVLHFPLALVELFDAIHQNPPKAAKAQMKKAIAQARKLLKAHPHYNLRTNLSDTDAIETLGLLKDWEAFRAEAKAHKQASMPHRDDRTNNPDKYATDISSRFAALNAKRNLKGY